MQHLRRPLLVIWDRLPGHRSADVRDFVAAQRGRLTLEWLPGYAPDRHGVLQVVKGKLRERWPGTAVRAPPPGGATVRTTRGWCRKCVQPMWVASISAAARRPLSMAPFM